MKARAKYELNHILERAAAFYPPTWPKHLNQFLCHPATFLNKSLEDSVDDIRADREERVREKSGDAIDFAEFEQMDRDRGLAQGTFLEGPDDDYVGG